MISQDTARTMEQGDWMTEYFIVANSFAAPFFSDTSKTHVSGDSPRQAMELFVASYNHPCGLFAAACYASADAFQKGESSLAEWRSNRSKGVDGNPKDGKIYE